MYCCFFIQMRRMGLSVRSFGYTVTLKKIVFSLCSFLLHCKQTRYKINTVQLDILPKIPKYLNKNVKMCFKQHNNGTSTYKNVY